MVQQIIKDFVEISLINEQLEKLGHNIGVRIIDEFLAKSGINSCTNFKETAEQIAKVAFRMFLGVSGDVTSWNSDNTSCSIILYDNPLIDFVELPPQYAELQYCNILIGVIKGSLEMVQLQVDCRFIRDILKGDEVTELRLELKGTLKNIMSDDYKEN